MSKIIIKQLNKSYANKTVFKDFCLEIDANKNTCILGESGQGKTTLLKMIAGIEKIDSGTIDSGAIDFSIVFQEPMLLPWLTVRQNIAYVLKRKLDNALLMPVLEKLSIDSEVDSYPAELSGGMKQRVALARAILYKADIILMDEPFQNLDIKSKAKSIDLYKEVMKGLGVNFVFVSHDIDEAIKLADDIIVLKGLYNSETLTFTNKEEGIKTKIMDLMNVSKVETK